MINNFNKKLAGYSVIGLVCILICLSCEKTDLTETYDQYIPENVVSLAKPDSVAAIPTAYNKLTFKVFINADPKIKKVLITLFDDDETDDDDKVVTTIDVNRTVYQPEIYEVELELPEGGKEYFAYIEDDEGNQSIDFDFFGTVLGDEYRATLPAREQTNVRLYSENEVLINWKSNRATIVNNKGEEEIVVVNEYMVKTEITYTSSVDGTEQTIVVDESEDETIVPDFISEGTYTYTTFYYHTLDNETVFESNPTEGTFPTKI